MRFPDRYKFVLFSIIGIFNTFFDVVLYTILRMLGQSLITANVISASIALLGSYFLNSRLTFKSKDWSLKTFIYFATVTLFGLWVIQTGAIYFIVYFTTRVPEGYWAHLGGFVHPAKLALPKLLATATSFIWNYVWYNKVIFRNRSKGDNALLSLDDL